MSGRHVVFGCNGPVGVELMEQLGAAGHEVVGVCRSGRSDAPAGARIEAGDVADVDSARRVAEGADVVYSCIGIPYPAWLDQWPPIIDGLLAAAESADARLIFADNLYCYGPQQTTLTEDLPLTDFGNKPALRARLARTMLDAHESGRTQAVLVRASDFYGPRVLNSALGERVFPRVLAGKAAQVIGSVDLPHTFTYVPDFARALVTLGTADDDAYGQAWHVPSAPAKSQGEVIRRIGEFSGLEARAQPLPKIMLRLLAPFVADLRELKEMMYQWESSFEADHSKFAGRFWGDFTPLDEGLRATIDWYREESS